MACRRRTLRFIRDNRGVLIFVIFSARTADLMEKQVVVLVREVQLQRSNVAGEWMRVEDKEAMGVPRGGKDGSDVFKERRDGFPVPVEDG